MLTLNDLISLILFCSFFGGIFFVPMMAKENHISYWESLGIWIAASFLLLVFVFSIYGLISWIR